MPTLKQLIDDLSWNDLLETLTVRQRGPSCYVFFENILKQLRYLDPLPSHVRILAIYTPCEDGDYIHICGLDGEIDPHTGQEQHWDISYTRWEEWLGMEIDPHSVAEFSSADIVAACLHDMSWDGRSQTTIRNKRRERSRLPLVFISHASEDKDSVAKPLARELEKLGLDVWFDEFELKIGDSLRARISDAISRADYAVVILSKDFFRKKWTQRELSGLITLEMSRGSSVLPIWHGVTASEVTIHDPSLADKIALSTANLSIEAIAVKISEAIYVKRMTEEHEDE